MSPMAAILRQQGYPVSGSDRARDQRQTPEKFAQLESLGVRLFTQDGSGITPTIDAVVVSSAIEESIPDIQAARRQGIPILKRAEILAGMFEGRKGIAVGGTSGKTTVTGMTGHILAACGFDPVIVNGGVMINVNASYRTGRGDWIVAETDESDGSIALFTPRIAILNNVTLDHKPIAELRGLFHDFIGRAKAGSVVNYDDPEACSLAGKNPDVLGFGIENPAAMLKAYDIVFNSHGSTFTAQDMRTQTMLSCQLNVPGHHNILNALAAVGAATLAGIDMKDAVQALAHFKGIRRRLEVTGTACGITIIDDFAHNPDKIAATLATLRQSPGRLLVMFQPHGYGPMKMMRKELAEAFASGLRPEDILVMPEIFYAGGTAARDISSADLIGDIAREGRKAIFVKTRGEAGDYLVQNAAEGDRIVVMGARDDTLSLFAREILGKVS